MMESTGSKVRGFMNRVVLAVEFQIAANGHAGRSRKQQATTGREDCLFEIALYFFEIAQYIRLG